MKHINKILLTAVLGSSLLALESCRKWDTNRLTGVWKLTGGDVDIGPGQEIIFDFKQDGDFIEETTFTSIIGGVYIYTSEGEWDWAPGKKIDIRLDEGFGYNNDRQFDVAVIQGKDMELIDEYNYTWIFVKQE